MKPSVNLKGIGERQKQIIRRMANEKLIIREFHDIGRLERFIDVEDVFGANSYESLKPKELEALINRGIVIQFEACRPSIFTDYYRYRLSVHVAIQFREYLYLRALHRDCLPF